MIPARPLLLATALLALLGGRAQAADIDRTPAFPLAQGSMQCKDAATLVLTQIDAQHAELHWKGRDYRLERESSAAGAYHFDNVASGLVLVQIPAKSMLLDHKRMTRLADECNPRPQLAAR